MPTPAKNNKPLFKTSSPFAETNWPIVAQEDQQVILDLVCNLISPLGDNRRIHRQPSKGKKRKRMLATSDDDSTQTKALPPLPEIGKHILIGVNSVTRHLEALVANNAPRVVPSAVPGRAENDHQTRKEAKDLDDAAVELRPVSMVFVSQLKSSQSIAHAHLPTLVHLSNSQASSNTPLAAPLTTTRLVSLPVFADTRIASCLGIPRVGALAIFEGAPGANALEAFVRQRVGFAECKWIDEAVKAEWMGTSVNNEGAIKKQYRADDTKVGEVEDGKEL